MSLQSWIFVSNALGFGYVTTIITYGGSKNMTHFLKLAFASLTLFNLFELLVNLGYLVKVVR